MAVPLCDCQIVVVLLALPKRHAAPVCAQGIAGLWGGDLASPPQPPRVVDLDTFASDAVNNDAIVVLALHGPPAENGDLQLLLQSAGLRFSGVHAASGTKL